MFKGHYHEMLPEKVAELYNKLGAKNSRSKLKRKLIDSNITWDGVKLIPVSYIPRILPKSYKQTIEKAARLVTETVLSAYQEKDSLRMPGLNNLLIDEFGILDRLPSKIIGSARYDFAVCEELTEENLPKLLEINMLDYGGIGWVPGINRAVLDTAKGLSELVTDTKLTDNLVSNFRNLGNRVLFIYDEDFTYADFSNFYHETNSLEMDMIAVSSQQFSNLLKTNMVQLHKDGLSIQGWDKKIDFIYMRALSTYKEIIDSKEMLHAILDSKVPMYDGFASLLLENKSLLSLFKERCKDKTLAEKIFLNSEPLNDDLKKQMLNDPAGLVLKYSDSHFGENVYVGNDIREQLIKINDNTGWCVQDFTRLNTNDVWPLGQGKSKGIVDLAVFVNYVWENDRLEEFSIAGYLCRSSKNDFKVNVSRGGCFVPVFFTK